MSAKPHQTTHSNSERPVPGLGLNALALDTHKHRIPSNAASSLLPFRCRPCHKSFSTQNAYQNHLVSRKHIQGTTPNPTIAESGPSHQLPKDLKTPISSAHDSINQSSHVPFKVNETDPDPTSSSKVPSVGKPTAGSSLNSDQLTKLRIDPSPEINLNECLFCPASKKPLQFDDVDHVLKHMSTAHGFFLPDQEFLVDKVGLLKHLAQTISVWNVCIYCGASFGVKIQDGRHDARLPSATKDGLNSVRKHMREKNHCTLAWDTKEDRLKYSAFFDYGPSYTHNAVNGAKKPKSKSGVKISMKKGVEEQKENSECKAEEESMKSDDEIDLHARYRILASLADNLTQDLSIKNQVIQVLQTDRDEAYKDRDETERKMAEMIEKLQHAVMEQKRKRDQQVHKIASIIQTLTSEVEAVMSKCDLPCSQDTTQLSSKEVHQFQTHLKSGKDALENFQEILDQFRNSNTNLEVRNSQLTKKIEAYEKELGSLRQQISKSPAPAEEEAASRMDSMSELRSKSYSLRHELKLTKRALETAERGRSEALEELQKLRKELKSVNQTHLSERRSNLESLAENQDQFNQDRTELMLKLKTSNQQIEDLRVDLERLKSRACENCETKEIHATMLEEERDRLQNKLSEMKNQLDVKESQITRLRKIRSDLKQDIVGLNIALQAKQQENSYLKRDRLVRQDLNCSSLGTSTKTSSTRNTMRRTMGFTADGTVEADNEQKAIDPTQQINYSTKTTKSTFENRHMLSSINNVSKIKDQTDVYESISTNIFNSKPSRWDPNSRQDQVLLNQADQFRHHHHQETRLLDDQGSKEIGSIRRTSSFVSAHNNDQSKYTFVRPLLIR